MLNVSEHALAATNLCQTAEETGFIVMLAEKRKEPSTTKTTKKRG
jgi:hypothetical protein